MSFSKFKIYTKLGMTYAIIAVVVLFIIANRKPVEVNALWFKTFEMPTYAFIVVNAFLGILFYLSVKVIRRVLREYRQVKYETSVRESLIEKNKANETP